MNNNSSNSSIVKLNKNALIEIMIIIVGNNHLNSLIKAVLIFELSNKFN